MVDQVEKDSGESFIEGQGVTLSCRNIAPGLTLHELAVAFEKAKNEAEPGDEVAGDPSKWPNVRGIQAVVDAMNNAYTAYNPNKRLREALEPFARLAEQYDPPEADDEHSLLHHDPEELCIGHLRKAREALASTSPSGLRE